MTPIRHGRLRDLERIDYGNPKACRECPLRARCTNDVRSVSRLENEAVLDRMAERLKARPEILDRRREVVEHPFGSIKQWMYQGAFLMRGLANVRAEFSLTALAYNLRRALNIVGVEALIGHAFPLPEFLDYLPHSAPHTISVFTLPRGDAQSPPPGPC